MNHQLEKNKIKKGIAGGFMTFLLFAVTSQNTHAVRWEDRRAHTFSRTNEASRVLGKVRDEIFQEKTGVVADLTTLSERMKRWIGNLAGLQAFVDTRNQGNLTRLEAELAREIAKNGKEFDQIWQAQNALQKRILQGKNKLRGIELLSYQPDHYEGEYKTLVSAIEAGKNNLETLGRHSKEVTEKLLNAFDEVYSLLTLRLRLRLVNIGIANVDEIMARVQGVLKADSLLRPYLSRLNGEYYRFNRAFLAARYFSLKGEFENLQNKCQEISGAVSVADVHARVKEIYLNNVNGICQSSRENMALLDSRGAGAVTASSIHDYRLPALARKCSQSDAGLAKCGMLAWLGKISRDQILAMSEDQLKALEKNWDNAEGI